MGLYLIPGYDAWKLDHPDNYATDGAECPQWLVDELKANHAFVSEALANAPSMDAVTAAAISRSPIALLAASDACVAEYIDAAWQAKPDADALSREWRKWAVAPRVAA